MAKCLVIFEDEKSGNFNPLALLRPVYFLRPGIRTLAEKILDDFDGYHPNFFCRPEIAAITSELTRIPVNNFEDKDFEEIIFINGRVRYNHEFIRGHDERSTIPSTV